MITKAFAVYDHKAEFYGVPFFMQQVGLAVRAFSDLVNDRDTTVSRHPADYSLFEIGTFDDSTGTMETIIPHRLLGHGSDFKPTPEGAALVRGSIDRSVPSAEAGSTEPVIEK